MVEVMNLLQRL